jgi:hypothetical protein
VRRVARHGFFTPWFFSYGLQKPDHAIFEHHPTINSELLHYIKLGRIKPHPDVAKIQGDTVHFVDGSSEQFDMIVYATGYNLGTSHQPTVEVHSMCCD